MTLLSLKTLGSVVVGVSLAAGLSYCLIDRPPVETMASQRVSPAECPTLDAAIEASFETKYSGIPDAELRPVAKELYERIQTLTKADAERRVAEGEFEEFPYVSGESSKLSPTGVSVSAGVLTVTGPVGAKIARHVVIPEGYDEELDLLRLEYSWLISKCGDWVDAKSSKTPPQ